MKKFALLVMFSVCAINISGTSFLWGLERLGERAPEKPPSTLVRMVDVFPRGNVDCCAETLKGTLKKITPVISIGFACWLVVNFIDRQRFVNQ